jgi:hypothetical protein
VTFDIGRELIDGHDDLYCYSPERSIIDAFRLAHREGSDTAITALRRWLRGRGNYPAKLLGLAEAFQGRAHASARPWKS